jgi:hypothetical protein
MIDFSSGPDVEEFMVLLPITRSDQYLAAKERLLDHLARAVPRFRFALADVPAFREDDRFVVIPVMSVAAPGKDAMRLCRQPDPDVYDEIDEALYAFQAAFDRGLN